MWLIVMNFESKFLPFVMLHQEMNIFLNLLFSFSRHGEKSNEMSLRRSLTLSLSLTPSIHPSLILLSIFSF